MPQSTGDSTRHPPVLVADGLTKHFPVHNSGIHKRVVRAVDEIDLSLYAGRVVALVGESGSGKSTVARLLAQLYPATDGQVLLDGKPVKVRFGRKFRNYCRKVQMIFQDPFASLNPVHTVGYTLRRSLKIHSSRRLGEHELNQMLRELLERVQLEPASQYIDKFPHELSGGQRQRVAIARALGGTPKVLLADEPVSMLDVSIRLELLNLLVELKDKMHLAILYITHDIASARYFAEETMVMYAGRIVERGTSEDVTQRPAHPYTKLLIDSAPDPFREQVEPGGARGEPPSLISPPAGCRFHPRCPQAMERCRVEAPGFFGTGDGHEAACWLYADEDGSST